MFRTTWLISVLEFRKKLMALGVIALCGILLDWKEFKFPRKRFKKLSQNWTPMAARREEQSVCGEGGTGILALIMRGIWTAIISLSPMHFQFMGAMDSVVEFCGRLPVTK